MNFTRVSRLLPMLLAVVAPRLAATSEPPLPATQDPLTEIAPIVSLQTFAAAHGLPLAGLDLAAEGAAPRKGDQVTLLVTLYDGTAFRQWLACLETDDLTEKERAMKPPDDATINTSTGLALRYTTTQSALRIKFIGPFDPTSATAPTPDKSLIKEARTLVSPEYLASGFDRYCRAALAITPRVNAIAIKPFYSAGSAPRSAEVLKRAKPFTDAVQLTPEEERLTFGVYFSVMTFFSTAMEIDAFEDVLGQVVDKPSLWSLAKNRGLRVDLNFWWMWVQNVAADRTGVALPAYRFPIKIFMNGALGVTSTLAVTMPRPPLEACAGILAICAEHPTEPGRRVFIRLLAARRAGGEKG